MIFEGKTDLATFLNGQPGYRVDDVVVFYDGEKVVRIFKKHAFYRYLKEIGVEWEKIISKKLLPDDSIYVIINNTLFIINVNTSRSLALLTKSFKPAISRENSIKN